MHKRKFIKCCLIIYILSLGLAWSSPSEKYNRKADIVIKSKDEIYINGNLISKKDKKCLQDNIYFEARGSSKKGKLAVAEVTLNRVKSYMFPNTICGVVYHSNQFSWTKNKNRKIKEKETYKNLEEIVDEAIFDYVINSFTITNHALFYHNTNVKPYWAKLFYKTKQIGNHIFYRHNEFNYFY